MEIILEQWGLGKYINNFKDEGITLEHFQELKTEPKLLETLINKMGHRLQFLKNFNLWSKDIELPDLEGNIEEEKTEKELINILESPLHGSSPNLLEGLKFGKTPFA